MFSMSKVFPLLTNIIHYMTSLDKFLNSEMCWVCLMRVGVRNGHVPLLQVSLLPRC